MTSAHDSDGRRVLPYGEWPSPITAAFLTQATATRPAPLADGKAVYALRTRPDTGAIVHLTRLAATAGPGSAAGGPGEEVSPVGFSVGSRVHEYGGGEYAVRDGVILAVDRATQRLWRLDGTPRPLVAASAGATVRFAAMEIDGDRGIAYVVREDHRGIPEVRPEPVNALVRVPLDGSAASADGSAASADGSAASADEGGDEGYGTLVTIERRAGTPPEGPGEGPGQEQDPDVVIEPDLMKDPDFVIDPVLAPGGARLAWVQWSHPHMPWDAAEVWVGELDQRGDVVDARRVAGGPERAAFEPVWVGPDRLAVLDERTGWVNPYLIDVRTGAVTPLHAVEQEYGAPPWAPRLRMMTALPDGRLVAVRWIDGFAQLTALDPARAGTPGAARDLGPRRALADYLSVLDAPDGGPGTARVVLRSAYPDRPAAVVAVDPETGTEQTLWRYGQDVPAGFAAPPQPVSWPGAGGTDGAGGADGVTAYGFLYLPTHPEVTGPAEARPPLIVLSHGGPTSATHPALAATTAYWTSRGIAVLDVNYGGSTGYGRAYRERLSGTWGIVDVGDCVLGAQHLAETGVVDPARLAIRGGSAGGFITLAALTFHDVFTAGLSSYGVSDLSALARDTHKFESRYPYRLIGPWPQAEAIYRERSPLHHVDRLATPLLLLQGLDDKVVPPDQARLMADAVRAKGLPVALIEFPGEGHGFREPANVIRALEAETSFLAQVWGYSPADDIDPV